jgi:hypothetical protein
MEFPTSDSNVIGAKQNTYITFFYFVLLGCNGRCSLIFFIFSCLGATGVALLLNVMTFFLRRVYVRHVIQMFIDIATGIKFVVQIQVLKKHPIYYMYIGNVYTYSDWAIALSAGKSPISGRRNPLKVPKIENRSRATSRQ